MTFDWRDYLTFAELISVNDTPASNRAGISRAYYAVFGHARKFCVETSLLKLSELKSPQIHSLLTSRLIESDDEELFTIGKRIDTLKLRRKEADYEAFSKDIDNKFLIDTIDKSHQILKLISDYQ